MITAEKMVDTILNVEQDDESVGEGVPANATIMVVLDDGTLITPQSLLYDKESGTLFIKATFF